MHTGRLWSSCISDGLESEKLVRRVKHGRLHKQHLSPQLLEAAVEVGPGTDQRVCLVGCDPSTCRCRPPAENPLFLDPCHAPVTVLPL